MELLPQFADAPENRFAPVGRARRENDDGDTIACLSGFILNMAERTVTLSTPYNSSKKYPLGQKFYGTQTFTDADDFREVMRNMIQTYMPTAPMQAVAEKISRVALHF